MKKLSFTSLGIALVQLASAQFHAGSSFIVKANTPVAIDSVSLQPATDLDLSGNELTISYQPVVNTNPSGSSISRVASWTSPLTYQGTLGLYYDNAELNGNNANLLNLVYHTGQSGYSGNNLFTTSNTGNHVIATTGIQTITLSSVTAVNSGTILPLHLISFEARKSGQHTLIKWETAYERAIHHFGVEKADGSGKFIFLSSHDAGLSNYQALDTLPATGWNYYRLKIVAEDGSHSYSHVAGLYFDTDGTSLALFPNPVSEILHVHIEATAEMAILYTLSGVDGKVIKKGTMNLKRGGNTFHIDVSSLAAGHYVFSAGNGVVRKIVKR